MAKDLEGKVFLVTGGTEGIGKAAVREFAERGATLVVVGRNPEKTARVIDELKAATGNQRIEPIIADLSKLSDVRRVAEEFRSRHDRLDVLVNNAGATFDRRLTSPDGFELTFALNHLAYFQLTVALLDLLRKTPGARVVSTSSAAHLQGKLDLEDIAERRKGRQGWAAYADSKLANILFTRELKRRLEGSGAVANCFHPGLVATAFGHNTSGFLKTLLVVGQKFVARTPEKGAETLVWLATAPEAARFNGEYFQDRKLARRSRRAKDDQAAAGLWKLSEELVARA